MRTAILVGLSVAACDRSHTYENIRSHTYENIGEACIGEVAPFATYDTGAAMRIDEGDTLPITVILSTCSSGSVEWSDQVCDVSGSGTRIDVETSGRTKSPRRVTLDCQWVDQACTDVTFEAGDWTLAYGGREVTFTVPYEGPTICTGPVE